MKRMTAFARGVLVLTIVPALLFSASRAASAAPTAEFSFSPKAPSVGTPVTFSFTGTCDVEPCTIAWRWFSTSGSFLGTTMGQGLQIDYAFDAPGEYSVVAKITNGTSTHGTATATHVVTVRAVYQDSDRQVVYDGWRGVANATASGGGYRVGSWSRSRTGLSFSGPAVTYVARTGPSLGVAEVAVDGVTVRSVDLYASSDSRRTVSISGLGTGDHRVVVRSTGTKNSRSSGTAVSLDTFVVGATPYDDTDMRVTYDSWVNGVNARADAGTVRSSAAPATSTGLVFVGNSVTWLSERGPDQGKATIRIDGTAVATVDNAAASRIWRVARTYDGLGPGTHTIKVVVLGRHSADSVADRIASDAFIVA